MNKAGAEDCAEPDWLPGTLWIGVFSHRFDWKLAVMDRESSCSLHIPIFAFFILVVQTFLLLGCNPAAETGPSKGGDNGQNGLPFSQSQANHAATDGYPPSAQKGTLVRVADGDTFEFKLENGRQVRVRMFGVDAPEWKQEWGRNSADCLRDLLSHGDLSIVEKYKDPYHRSVSVVYYGTKDINRTLVEQGCAWAFRRYSSDYVNSETKARQSRAGLWSGTHPQPPWDWRRMNH